jgi:hypothetical protein
MTSRRTFLKYFSSAAICGGHPSLMALEQSPRSGKFLITVQAPGGGVLARRLLGNGVGTRVI